MVTPDVARKKCGCWCCQHRCILPIEEDPEVTCQYPDSEIRENFAGWNTALTCKGFLMSPYTVELKKGAYHE